MASVVIVVDFRDKNAKGLFPLHNAKCTPKVCKQLSINKKYVVSTPSKNPLLTYLCQVNYVW